MNKADKDKVIAALEMALLDAHQVAWYDGAKTMAEAVTIMRGLAEDAEPVNNEALWLWKNGDHMLAYRHLYPCYPGGDPMVLGEPVAKAYLRQSFDRGGTSPQAAQTEEREAFESWASAEISGCTRGERELMFVAWRERAGRKG